MLQRAQRSYVNGETLCWSFEKQKKQQHVLFKVVSFRFWVLILTAGRRRPARRWRPAGPEGWTSFCRRSPGGGTLRGPSSVRSRDTERRCESKIQRRRQVVHTDASRTHLQQNLHRENGGEGVVGVTKNLHKWRRHGETHQEVLDASSFTFLNSFLQVLWWIQMKRIH